MIKMANPIMPITVLVWGEFEGSFVIDGNSSVLYNNNWERLVGPLAPLAQPRTDLTSLKQCLTQTVCLDVFAIPGERPKHDRLCTRLFALGSGDQQLLCGMTCASVGGRRVTPKHYQSNVTCSEALK